MSDAPPSAAARRTQVLRFGVVTAVLNRGVAAIVPLLLVPTGLRYLGATEYGAWATAVSLTAFAAFGDLGMGTGLMTRLGASQGQRTDEARGLVASAYALTCAISLSALVALWLSAPLVDWAAVLGVTGSPEGGRIETIVLLTFSAVILNIATSLVVRVQYGIGQQGQSNLWQTAGNAAALAAGLSIASLDAGRPWFVAAAAFAPVSVAAANSCVFFLSESGRRVRGGRRDVSLATIRSLLGLGGKFVVVSLLMTASIAIDPWIVARTTSLGEVPSYVIPFRIFTLIGTISVMSTMPLWPVHSQALASGDTAWVKRITQQLTVVLTSMVAVLCVAVVLLRHDIAQVWLGGGIEVDTLLWVGFAVWCCVQTSTGAAFMVLNGAEVLAPQIVGYALLLGTAVPLKWLVSVESSTSLLPWVGTGLYVLIIVPACYLGYRTALRRATVRPPVAEVKS